MNDLQLNNSTNLKNFVQQLRVFLFFNSPYAPGPVFGLKRKSPRLNDRKEGNIE